MRKAHAACVLALAGALASRTGAAQEAQAPPPEYKAQPLNLHREARGATAAGEMARTRMRKGEWAVALEAFDNAVRASTDPGLRRDRGLCHEHLGYAYPAIDDYRVYLTAVPEAPDSDGIRLRLERLEHETLGYSSASNDAPGDVEGGASARASLGADRAKASLSKIRRAQMDDVEREDDPLQTSLRRGKGWSFAPFLFVHKWGASPARVALPLLSTSSGSTFGDGGSWAEGVGLAFRYSLGPSSALMLEAAYEHFNSTVVDLAVVSGLTSQIAYEWRFPLDAEYQNQFILAPGLGYEHLAVQPGDAQMTVRSLGGFVPPNPVWVAAPARVIGWDRCVAGRGGGQLLHVQSFSVRLEHADHVPLRVESRNCLGPLTGQMAAMPPGTRSETVKKYATRKPLSP